jgi:hypothetical protein
MKRIEAATSSKDLFVSAYKGSDNKIVVVVVNPTENEQSASLTKEKKLFASCRQLITYTTDASNDLKKNIVTTNKIIIPSKSVVSVILN